MRVRAPLFASLASSIVFAGILAGTLAGCKKDTPPAPAPAVAKAGSATGQTGEWPVKELLYEPPDSAPDAIRGVFDPEQDRDDRDRALDQGRKPAEMLAFFKVAPGQRIGELFSGTGYTTELLARVLGAHGKLYAQNSKEIMDRFARQPMADRLAKPVVSRNTVLLETPADAPFPPEATGLDAVICVLNYHDFVWQKVDRAKLNAAVFAALKSGGIYGIIDHSAEKGSGVRDVETLHRIDEEVVKQEILAAGFKLDAENETLRNPKDDRTWNASPREAATKRGTSDRFMLRFVKP
jgi:predicted methyltransferase